MQNKNNYAVIMAGGIGSRFWPSSRSNCPKQFLDILGTGSSLLQQTYKRFLHDFLPENIYVVTNQAYVGLVKEQLPQIQIHQILAEPMGKNTAACVAYACGKISKINTHAICIVAPSDHLILDEALFLNNVQQAIHFAQKNHALVTLGIHPTRPDTGYGYIQYLEGDSELKKVKTFTEKPSLDLAKAFINSGDFLWNAGIFIFSISTIKAAFKEFVPEQFAMFKEALDAYFTDKESEVIQQIYEQTRAVSIDYAIMEKASNVYVMPATFGWNDLGTWISLYDISEKDADQNVKKGAHILSYNSENCMIDKSLVSANKMLVLNSVKDLIIVDTPDVLLISDKNKEQEVKDIFTDIKVKFNEKYS